MLNIITVIVYSTALVLVLTLLHVLKRYTKWKLAASILLAADALFVTAMFWNPPPPYSLFQVVVVVAVISCQVFAVLCVVADNIGRFSETEADGKVILGHVLFFCWLTFIFSVICVLLT